MQLKPFWFHTLINLGWTLNYFISRYIWWLFCDWKNHGEITHIYHKKMGSTLFFSWINRLTVQYIENIMHMPLVHNYVSGSIWSFVLAVEYTLNHTVVCLWIIYLFKSYISEPDLRDKAMPHAAMKWAFFLRFWASRGIADHRISSKIAAVWPVSDSRWDVFIISCDGHCCDGN